MDRRAVLPRGMGQIGLSRVKEIFTHRYRTRTVANLLQPLSSSIIHQAYRDIDD